MRVTWPCGVVHPTRKECIRRDAVVLVVCADPSVCNAAPMSHLRCKKLRQSVRASSWHLWASPILSRRVSVAVMGLKADLLHNMHQLQKALSSRLVCNSSAEKWCWLSRCQSALCERARMSGRPVERILCRELCKCCVLFWDVFSVVFWLCALLCCAVRYAVQCTTQCMCAACHAVCIIRTSPRSISPSDMGAVQCRTDKVLIPLQFRNTPRR